MPDKDFKETKKDPVIKDPEEHKKNEQAFEQAEEDIEHDPDMEIDKETDLDEGELARKEGHP
jgi:hypothetical protein